MKPVLIFIGLFLVTKNLYSQFGKNGSLTLSTGTTIVNQYTSLSINVSVGQNTLVVTSITDLNIPSPLTCGDLIMLYEAQGANMTTTNSSSYGTITNYNNAGVFEFIHVSSVNGNTITLTGPLSNSYTVSGKTQIIKVPQYSDLTVNLSAVISSNGWNGSKGGIIVIHANDSIKIDGKIYNTGKGFRGGIARTSGYTYLGTEYVSSVVTDGGEKGEGICGYQNDYDLQGGRYCRGAAGNAGGGGTNHNSGGGGGANASNGNLYNGAGVMCTTCIGINAWHFDADYINNSNAYTNSSGGGKGGNSFSSTPQNPLITPPGNSSWGSDCWRNVGGRGGKPLLNIDYHNRIYFGGGGGAGDANDNSGGNGANGGGIIILISPKIYGNGNIIANGDSAANSTNIHADALGGGGGGGSIIINSNIFSNNIKIEAKGGKGGSMTRKNGSGYVIGTGGGGGGGFISYPNTSAASVNVNGGLTGKNYYPTISNFPENGGTDGGTGLIQPSPSFTLITNINSTGNPIGISSVSNYSICAGQSVIITPNGASSYSISPGNLSGNSFTINPSTTTTYSITGINSCSSSYTTVTINVNPFVQISSLSHTICSGQTATLTASGATSYTWSANNTVANTVTVSPISTSIYTVIGSDGINCLNSKTVTVTVIQTPTLSINNPTICSGNNTTLTVNGATNYTWSSVEPISNPNTATIVVSPTITTNYTVTGTNVFCSNQSIITVSVIPIPIISITGNTFICSGQSTTLTVNGANTYTWDTGENSPTVNVSPTINTIYTVTGTVNGCTNETSILVNTSEIISIIGATTICSGQSVTLTANGANSYTWTNSTSPLSNQTGSVVISTPISGTSYTVTGSTSSCTSTAVIFINVNLSPTITAVSYTNTSCGLNNGGISITTSPSISTYSWSTGIVSNNNTMENLAPGNYTIVAINENCQTLTFVTISGSFPLVITGYTVTPTNCASNNGSINVTDNQNNSTYNWTPFIPNSSNSINNLGVGNYSLTVTNGLCSISSTFSVNSIGGPTSINFETNNTLCENNNGSIKITNISNGTPPYQYNFNNSGFSTNSSYNNLTNGNYTIIIKDSNGCIFTQTLSIERHIEEATIDLFINTPTCSDNDGSFIIDNIYGGTFPYLTSINNNPYTSNLIFEQLSSGTYTLMIKDSSSCETNFILTMPKNDGDYTIYIPNTFTPNNDQINDIWYVNGACLGRFHCYIYNRWGEKITELQDIKEGWNGTYKGVGVPDGVYMYLIEIEANDKLINKTGHITLFR